jgi:hypothetical protein
LSGLSIVEVSVPRVVPGWYWAFLLRVEVDDCVKRDHVHVDTPPFLGQSWFFTQKAVSSELAACLMHCTPWGLQATTAAGVHSAGGICPVATESQLDWKWSPNCMDFCEVHFCSLRIPAGWSTVAFLTAEPEFWLHPRWMKDVGLSPSGSRSSWWSF